MASPAWLRKHLAVLLQVVVLALSALNTWHARGTDLQIAQLELRLERRITELLSGRIHDSAASLTARKEPRE